MLALVSLPSPQPRMSGTGYASSRVGKAKAVEEVSDLLRKSSLVFSTPVAYLSANEVVRLRLNIPEGCTARVVKNKLMRIAAKDTGFEQVCEMTTGGNFWIFVESEDNLAAPIKYIQDFAKRMDPKQKVRAHGRHIHRLLHRNVWDSGKCFQPPPPPSSIHSPVLLVETWDHIEWERGLLG